MTCGEWTREANAFAMVGHHDRLEKTPITDPWADSWNSSHLTVSCAKEDLPKAYISLGSFTDQGARSIKDSPARFEAFKAAAEAAGISIKSVHWTTGAFDIVLVSEGSEEAMMAVTLKTAMLGNIRTQTLRGFSLTEMKKAVAGLG